MVRKRRNDFEVQDVCIRERGLGHMRRERVLESPGDDIKFRKRLLLGSERSLAIRGIFVDRRLERERDFSVRELWI